MSEVSQVKVVLNRHEQEHAQHSTAQTQTQHNTTQHRYRPTLTDTAQHTGTAQHSMRGTWCDGSLLVDEDALLNRRPHAR